MGSRVGQLANFLDGIPVVVNTAQRDAQFPAPIDTNQRVENLATGYIERYTGTTWVPDLVIGNAGPILNAQAFGAKADGTTDDTAAIQAAVTAAGAAKSALFFPPTSTYYKITADISVANPVRIYGWGAGSKIQNDTSNFGIFTLADGVTDVEISDLFLKSTSPVSVLGRSCVYINPNATGAGVRRVWLRNLRIECGGTSGISANQLIDSWITDCSIDNLGTGEHGIYLSNSGGDSQNVFISRVIARSSLTSNRIGLQLRGCKQIHVLGYSVYGFQDGVLCSVGNATVESEFAHIFVSGCGRYGFDSFDAALLNSKVNHLRLYDCGTNGIRSDGGIDSCQFNDIEIIRSIASGIRVNSVVNSTFDNILVIDADNGGIGAGGDDSAAYRFNSGNGNNRFTNLRARTSGSKYRYAWSNGSGDTVTNKFVGLQFDAGRTGTYDLGANGNTFVEDPNVSADRGDNNVTLQAPGDAQTQRFATALTGVRTVTLNAAFTGARFRITREATATGASALNVGTGPLKALAVGQWCEVVYNASGAWVLSTFGSL